MLQNSDSEICSSEGGQNEGEKESAGVDDVTKQLEKQLIEDKEKEEEGEEGKYTEEGKELNVISCFMNYTKVELAC